MKGKARSE